MAEERIGRVGLPKLFLWSEAERFHTVPEALAKAESDREYTAREIAQDLFGLRFGKRDGTRPLRGNVLRNCFGWDRLGPDKIAILGFNAFRAVSEGRYALTPGACHVAQAYRAGDEDAWACGLARLLAQFEVRTRLILYLLGEGGWRLCFPTPEFYSHPSSKTTLERDGESLALFAPPGAAFNRLLSEHSEIALGAWWQEELRQAGLDIGGDFSFEGLRSAVPTIDKLSSRLKCSLLLLKYLGAIEFRAGGWALCPRRLHDVLGADVAKDFIAEERTQAGPPIAELQRVADKLQDVEGFVVASVLAETWAAARGLGAAEAALAFDDYMRSALYEGRLRIVARHQGQPRHGRGLFGDDTARKIKLEF